MSYAKQLAVAAALVSCLVAQPALAEVRVHVGIGIPVAPPPPVVEVVPMPAYGQVWTPGYWAWHHDRYIWVRGRQVVARPGFVWAPDRWDPRGPRWHHVHGGWVRHKHAHRHHRHGHR